MHNANPYESPQGNEASLSLKTETPPRFKVLGGYIGIATILSGFAFNAWVLQMSGAFSWFVIAIVGWIATPYALLWLATRQLMAAWARLLLSATLIGTVVFGVYAFSIVNQDAQGGIVLIVAPFYQIAGIVVVVFVLMIADRMFRRAE
ncbi:MAG: hypothetical protein AB8B91_03215 [Rubripirellula sp.]